jgi:transposase
VVLVEQSAEACLTADTGGGEGDYVRVVVRCSPAAGHVGALGVVVLWSGHGSEHWSRPHPERTVADIARELGVDHETLRQWVIAADEQQVREAAGLGQAELEELKRLGEENAELKVEKEILRKAAQYFATEMGR